MKENFWGQWSEEYLKDHPELPPFTDQLLAAFKKRSALELPPALIDLLRTKNGGRLHNTDFKLGGNDCCVSEIVGLGIVEDFSSIRSYAFMLAGEHCTELREKLTQKVDGDLSKVLLFADSGGYPDAFALNFNHLNSTGEPTVYRVATDGDYADAELIADCFDDFLKGQYFGDERPSVEMKDADKYRLLAEGSYTGTHDVSGKKVEMVWKMCLDGSRILVFQKENWGWGEKVARMEIKRSQLQESYGVLDFLFGLYQRFALWRLGKGIGADLSHAANDKRICISNEDAPLKPKCFKLTFHTHNLGDELTEDSWIRIRTSEPFEGRWKNWESKVWNDAIYSADRTELIQAQNAIVGI